MGEIAIPREFLMAVHVARRGPKGAILFLCEVDGFGDKKAAHGTPATARMRMAVEGMFTKHLEGSSGRIGEEQLYTLVPGTGDLRSGVERFRRAVEGFSFSGESEPFHATVSIGMATLAQSRGSAAKLLAYATEALREAQSAGDNRIELAPKGTRPHPR